MFLQKIYTESVQFPLLIFVTLSVLYFLIFRKSKKWELLQRIPGPPKLPIFGNALEAYVENYKLLHVFENWVEQYGKRVFLKIGPSPRVLIADKNDVEKVLSSHVHIHKSQEYHQYLSSWLGSGLLTSSGEKWLGRRKMLTPAFHFRILESFLRVFNEQSSVLVQNFEKFSTNQETFDVFPYITRCALDIISETAMGIRLNSQSQLENEDSDYVKSTYRLSELTLQRSLRPWLQPEILWRLSPSGRDEKRCLKIIHDFGEKVIRERKLELAQMELNQNRKIQVAEDDIYTKGKRRLAFLDLLLEAQAQEAGKDKTPSSLSDRDIREEVDTIMFAGHDTTTANISWTLFLIGSHPEVQVRVQAELDEIFEDDGDRSITSDDLSRMKYLESCIKETLRIYPSVPVIGRSLLSDLKLDDGVVIPGGTTLYVFPYFLHRDAEVFPEPDKFLPERFFPETANGRHPFAYTPFSAGPRNCIGQKYAMMEIKVSLAHVLRKFNVRAMEKAEDVLLCVDLILRPKNGIPLKISRRNLNSVLT